MEVKASAKFIKMSPRKVRIVADVVRGLGLQKAFEQLQFINKKAAGPIVKLLKSALANAENNFELKKDNLIIKEIRINGGPTLHRWMPRARGRATPIRKRTSHIDVVLGELVDSGEVKGKKQKLENPVKLGASPKKEDSVKVDSKKSKEKDGKEESKDEKGKTITDPRSEGKGKNIKIEGKGSKGFGGKFFRRKSG